MEKFEIYLQSTGTEIDNKMRWIWGGIGFLYLSIGILLKYKYYIGENYIFTIGGTAFLIINGQDLCPDTLYLESKAKI